MFWKWIKAMLAMGVLVVSFGCAREYRAAWTGAQEGHATAQSENKRAEADRLFERVRDEASLDRAIAAYTQVLELNPADKKALALLGTLYILKGTAYVDERQEKREYFAAAMRYAELSMFTNGAFAEAMRAGKKVWDAADTLEADDAPAMLFWVTALHYDFKEGMTLPEKIANVGWMNRCLPLLDRIKQVDPEFGNGAVEFAFTICYCVLPSFQGGNKAKGMAFMQAAVEKNSGYLLPRWARGKYFHQVTGDIDTSVDDLRWVAQQGLDDYDDPYPWRVHFIEDARVQLKRMAPAQ